MRPAEMGQTIGPSSEPMGVGGSVATPEVSVEEGSSVAVPHELMGVDRSAATRKVSVEGGGSTVEGPDPGNSESH